jgi:hypothetical protein
VSEAAIVRFDLAAQDLRRAMEDGDPSAINSATEAFAAALDTVRGVDAWHTDLALKDRLRGIIARLDSDQHLSRFLGDQIRQRLSLFAGVTSDATAPLTSGRKG